MVAADEHYKKHYQNIHIIVNNTSRIIHVIIIAFIFNKTIPVGIFSME